MATMNKAWIEWLELAVTKFGLTNKDVANILNQRKKNPEWQPTSNSGKKTFWAWVVWMDLRPPFKVEEETTEVTE